MSLPTVHAAEEAIEGLRRHSLSEAKKYGHETMGWLLGFFKGSEVFVLESERCTRYLRQSQVEAEAHPSQESEVAFRHPRDVGIVGLYHSHPFRDDYHRPQPSRVMDEMMFHSEIDGLTLRSRSRRNENYLSVVTDGQNTTFFVFDRASNKVVDVEPRYEKELGFGTHLRSYGADINLILQRDIKAKNLDEIVKELERYIIDYVYKNVEHSDVEFSGVGKNQYSVRLFAFEEDVAGDNIIRIEKTDSSYSVDLRLSMSPKVFVTGEDEVLRALKDEIADNILYLIRTSFEPQRLLREKVGLLEFHLGSIRVDINRLPTKKYLPPKRRMIIRKR